jgi:hypothetical protein
MNVGGRLRSSRSCCRCRVTTCTSTRVSALARPRPRTALPRLRPRPPRRQQPARNRTRQRQRLSGHPALRQPDQGNRQQLPQRANVRNRELRAGALHTLTEVACGVGRRLTAADRLSTFPSAHSCGTKGERSAMRKKLTAAVCAVAFAALAAGSAFAGEVKGPPGSSSGGVQSDTAAPSHAHSACAFSGLNDNNQGQTLSITQNWGQDVKFGLGTTEGPPPGIGCNPTAGG